VPLPWPRPRRLLAYLAAILLGNGVYFLLLEPYLPPELRHQPFRIDAGMLVDFALCVVAYLLLRPLGD